MNLNTATSSVHGHMTKILRVLAGAESEEALVPHEKSLLSFCREVSTRMAQHQLAIPRGLGNVKALDYLAKLFVVYRCQLTEPAANMGRYVAILGYLGEFAKVYPYLEPQIELGLVTLPIPCVSQLFADSPGATY